MDNPAPTNGIDDQTEEAWKADGFAGVLGTGIYLTSGANGWVKKHMVPGQTYTECIIMGSTLVAFKWVPSTVKSYEELAQGCQVG